MPRLCSLLILALLPACADPVSALDLRDDPAAYLDDVAYRRGILERDLHFRDNDYADERFALYGLAGEGWELLPTRDRPARNLTTEDVQRLLDGSIEDLDVSDLRPLVPASVPDDGEEWIALGRDVVGRYPLRADPTYEALAGIEGGLERAGFFERADGAWVGLAVFQDEGGRTRIGPTCGQCHCSMGPYSVPEATLANKEMDLGAARLLVMGFDPDERPDGIEGTSIADHYDLGPGRADVLPDAAFNPFALPDLGGLEDMPYLQHNANWIHGGLATVAIRAETLFITSNLERSRIPRVLSWAAGAYLRSFAPPAPLDAEPGPDAEAGAQVFEQTGCTECHTPPSYTSDRLVTLDEVGTDPAAGLSRARGTGYTRIPSLRGVGRTGPYLHHGAVPTLEELLSPQRGEPGHAFGLELGEDERAQLLAFLRSI